jgi:hypothetical protein
MRISTTTSFSRMAILVSRLVEWTMSSLDIPLSFGRTERETKLNQLVHSASVVLWEKLSMEC